MNHKLRLKAIRTYAHSDWLMLLGIGTIHHELLTLNHKYRASGAALWQRGAPSNLPKLKGGEPAGLS